MNKLKKVALSKRYRIVLMIILCFVFVQGTHLFAQISDLLERVDQLNKAEQHQQVIQILTPALGNARVSTDISEIAWRLARAYLGFGDQRKDAGATNRELLDLFAQGEGFADLAIENNPQNHLGYFWKSSNIGRWGQTRGVLESLSRAPSMRDLLAQAAVMNPNHADSYYVLGQLYSAVPGVISFGNKDYAVSLARLAVTLNQQQVASGQEVEPNYGFYLKFAEHLFDRNWNLARRTREQETKRRNYSRTTIPLERGWYFEGTVVIPQISDREEARTVLQTLIGWLERKTNRTPSQERNLREARALFARL